MKDGTKVIGKWKLADFKRKVFKIDKETEIPFRKVRSTGFYKPIIISLIIFLTSTNVAWGEDCGLIPNESIGGHSRTHINRELCNLRNESEKQTILLRRIDSALEQIATALEEK